MQKDKQSPIDKGNYIISNIKRIRIKLNTSIKQESKSIGKTDRQKRVADR